MNNTHKPILSLNMDEKIYLAVSKNTDSKTAFVFTLACLRTNPNLRDYEGIPTREIHAFKNAESAEIYYNTIDKIVEINESDEKKQFLFKANEDLINHFLENVR